MKDEKLIDQSQLANDIAEKIEYDFTDRFLVKMLDPIVVKKEFSKPVSSKPAKKDKNGIEAVDYDKVETEVKEVESDFRKCVVIKVPTSYRNIETKPYEVNIGDVILVRPAKCETFDLLKDSKLVPYYAIEAVCR